MTFVKILKNEQTWYPYSTQTLSFDHFISFCGFQRSFYTFPFIGILQSNKPITITALNKSEVRHPFLLSLLGGGVEESSALSAFCWFIIKIMLKPYYIIMNECDRRGIGKKIPRSEGLDWKAPRKQVSSEIIKCAFYAFSRWVPGRHLLYYACYVIVYFIPSADGLLPQPPIHSIASKLSSSCKLESVKKFPPHFPFAFCYAFVASQNFAIQSDSVVACTTAPLNQGNWLGRQAKELPGGRGLSHISSLCMKCSTKISVAVKAATNFAKTILTPEPEPLLLFRVDNGPGHVNSQPNGKRNFWHGSEKRNFWRTTGIRYTFL